MEGVGGRKGEDGAQCRERGNQSHPELGYLLGGLLAVSTARYP